MLIKGLRTCHYEIAIGQYDRSAGQVSTFSVVDPAIETWQCVDATARLHTVAMSAPLSRSENPEAYTIES